MEKTQVYFSPSHLEALHEEAARSKRSVASLIREAVEAVWMRPRTRGLVALWDGAPRRTSVDHDSVWDAP